MASYTLLLLMLSQRLEVLLDAGQEPNGEPGCLQEQRGSKYRQIFALKCVPFLTAFALIYIGVEVTLGGERREFCSTITVL